MSNFVKFLKLSPLIFTISGILVLVNLFFVKHQTTIIKSEVKSDQILQKVAGDTTESEIFKPPTSYAQKVPSKVTRVIDGDTIELESGQKVRYIGINTSETVHPTKPVECFGREASTRKKELVEGNNVTLEKDVSETDKYGRLLRYVYIDGIFVNDYLVREGFANSSSYPPDIKYQDQFIKAEAEARQNNRGLWASCSSDTNKSIVSGQSITVESGANGCIIKGNISAGGKIYHMPGQYYYNKTQIDESRGEKWFCTEAEAQSAGWRKSKK